jgi:basic amino acid/polyamine antiporter, APA family
MSHVPDPTPNVLPQSKGDPHALARRMTLFSLVVYGVGDMVGAGVYGTIGDAAGQMGNAVWLAFIGSMIAALLTGLSYATISSRYPRAGGAAYVTHRAFRFPLLSYFVGLAVTASGLTSMATSTNVFAETLNQNFLALPIWVIILGFLGAITLLNLWGIRESMWGNLLCTSVEVGGLLLIIGLGVRFWGSVDYLQTPPTPDGESSLGLSLVLSGAVLTFFSFVGFEDMLNVSEEVKNPRRTMPLGILLALGITTVLYIAVSITVVSAVPYGELSKAAAAFEPVSQRIAPWLPKNTYSAITLFAVANTALINYIMGSRLIYGMARQGLVPKALSRVHATRRTPWVSILTLAVLVVILAMAGRVQFGDGKPGDAVKQLASATALLLLGCFCIVNVALIALKLRSGEPRGAFEVPMVVPALGVLVCAGLIVGRMIPKPGRDFEWRAPLIAIGVGVAILILYAIMRPQNVVHDEEVAPE